MTKKQEIFSQDHDPLSLGALQLVVSRLTALKEDLSSENSGADRLTFLVEQLESVLDITSEKYVLLKDRYSLLKRSNAALCDELVWLRDQIDDLHPTPGDEE